MTDRAESPRGSDTGAMHAVRVEVSPGEMIDKITILEIKTARIDDPAKVKNVGYELGILEAVRNAEIPASPELDRLTADLRTVNARLWDIEDEIRDCERNKNFGDRFIELARAVYHTNDRRAEIKKFINELLGARIVEEKSYNSY
jgi:hypothetical protein